MPRLIRLISRLSVSHPGKTLIVCITLAVLSLAHAFLNLNFDTNQDSLISKKQKYFQDYQHFLKEFKDWEYVYVVIRVPDGDRARAKVMAAELAARLKKRPDLYEQVLDRNDLQKLLQNGLLLLPQEEFKKLN